MVTLRFLGRDRQKWRQTHLGEEEEPVFVTIGTCAGLVTADSVPVVTVGTRLTMTPVLSQLLRLISSLVTLSMRTASTVHYHYKMDWSLLFTWH